MDIDLRPIADAVVATTADVVRAASPLMLGALLAFGHRAWKWMGSRIHGTDVMLIKGAIRTAAINAARNGPADPLIDDTLDGMVAYAKRTVGRIITKLNMTDDTLRDMCSAALAEAIDTYRAAQAAQGGAA